MMNILLFFMCLVTASTVTGKVYDSIQNTFKEDLELEAQLKLINKTAVKSIHTKVGEIVDCIDINKQPAFDHPLLKNHKLQKAKLPKINWKNKVKNSEKSMFGLEKDEYCPIGTVPIPRTTKDYLIRDRSSLHIHSINAPEGFPGIHYAEVSPRSNLGPFYGVSGTNSIFNPKVRADQVSSSNIFVNNEVNVIAVGWQVDPRIYSDGATHFFAAWTQDNFKKTGCANLMCPGFVQIHRGYYLGARAANPSVYGGKIFENSFSISQDPSSKNWWVSIANTNVGYYPAAIFSNLSSGSEVGWGGRTLTTPNTASPPMGSGHFPDRDFRHACYFRAVSFQKTYGQLYSPVQNDVTEYSDKTNCFGISYYEDPGQGAPYKYSLQFGGPGGNCGN